MACAHFMQIQQAALWLAVWNAPRSGSRSRGGGTSVRVPFAQSSPVYAEHVPKPGDYNLEIGKHTTSDENVYEKGIEKSIKRYYKTEKRNTDKNFFSLATLWKDYYIRWIDFILMRGSSKLNNHTVWSIHNCLKTSQIIVAFLKFKLPIKNNQLLIMYKIFLKKKVFQFPMHLKVYEFYMLVKKKNKTPQFISLDIWFLHTTLESAISACVQN